MLSIFYLLSGVCISTVSIYTLKQSIKKSIDSWKKDYDELILDYCISRTIIVCPKCTSLYEVKDLDEQLNTEWTCTVCGQSWEETPTHDVTRKKKPNGDI